MLRIIHIVFISLALASCSDRDTNTQNQNDNGQQIIKIVDNKPNLNTNKLVNNPLRVSYNNTSRNKEVTIYGEIIAPEGYEQYKMPIIILSPGFNNNLNFIANQYASQLASMGFVTYSLEFYGGYNGSRSGGTMIEMSPFTQVDDLTAVLNYFRTLPFVDTEQIYLLGFSQGGVVSAITAQENKDKVKGLLLLNAAFVLFDDAKALFKSVDEIPDVVNFRGNQLGKIYFERSINYDIYEKMPLFDKKTLIIHGQQDEVVPLSYAEKAQKTYPRANLHIISGGRHIFSASQNTQVINHIREYLSN